MRGIIRIRGKKGRERTVVETSIGTRNLNTHPEVAVTLNGVKARLADLKDGDVVEIDGKPAVNVTATRA